MRKILSLMAIAAMVLTMAGVMTSCEGNDPEQDDFQFTVKTLSNKAHVVVKATQTGEYFFFGMAEKSTIDNAGGVQKYVEGIMKASKFDALLESGAIVKNTVDDVFPTNAESICRAYACYVEKGVDGYAKIVGNIAYKTFTTLPAYTLNGEFTVNENGKKVCFRTSNLQLDNDGDHLYSYDQYTCYGNFGDNTSNPRDLFEWAKTERDEAAEVLTADEWWYLFRERPNAEKLFSYATISINKKYIHGLILLPDNWQAPDGISFKTGFDMGVLWDEDSKRYKNPDPYFDGFSKNDFRNSSAWEKVECSGAVFLPVAGYGENDRTYLTNSCGYYWSSTADPEDANRAFAFCFGREDLSVNLLTSSKLKAFGFCIRPVVVK